MTEHLTTSGGGEHPSLLKVSGPWKWQCMCMWGHIPYKQRGQPNDMGTAASGKMLSVTHPSLCQHSSLGAGVREDSAIWGAPGPSQKADLDVAQLSPFGTL